MDSLVCAFRAEFESEDMTSHIAILQKLFMDMNIELRNHNQNELSEIMLTLRIMSKLGKEYNSFRDVWDSLPSEKQTFASLIERFCDIEKRETSSLQLVDRRFSRVNRRLLFQVKTRRGRKECETRKTGSRVKAASLDIGECPECPAKTEDQTSWERLQNRRYRHRSLVQQQVDRG